MTGSNRKSRYSEIGSLVAGNGNINYDPLIADCSRNTLLQLSSLRHGLLNWYPFPADAEALEIGAGCGTLSGLLADRLARADMLEEDPVQREILSQRFPERNGEILKERGEVKRQYDFIFAVDLPAFYTKGFRDILEDYRSCLKEDGVFCIGFRNRSGLKYSCGALDDLVREPFATEGLPTLGDFRRQAEPLFKEIQIYCPFPDAYYPQAVYRSDCLPVSSFADRVRAFDPYDSPLVLDENEEYQNAIREGTLLEKSDFYLVFMSDRQLRCPVERVILSSDRGERSFMTIFEKDRVLKKAIRPQGDAYLEESAVNADKLRKRGIDVVPQSFEDKTLVMPYIRYRASLDVIAEAAVSGNGGQILKIFDSIYKDVCRSSEAGEADPEVWETGETAGPVLKEAFIDMIPYNAFWTDNGPCYYDQEFVWKNTPANFVMFRAIRYTSIHLGALFDPWKDTLFKRYGISGTLRKIYRKKENAFVDENRRRDLYHRFYDWTYISPDRIRENRAHLLHPEEDRELQAIHAIQLELLKCFDEFCRTHGLKYFALHGTLLGAVRHHGFIPWDDDVDLGMPREDYDRLVELYPNEKGYPYLQSMGKEGRIFYGGYAKFRDEDSVAIENHNRYFHGHKGVAIDILPLDYCDEDPEKRKKLQKKITEVQRCIYARCYPRPGGVMDDVSGYRLMKYYLLGRPMPLRFQFPLLNRLFRSVRESAFRTILACYYGDAENKNLFRDKDLDDLTRIPFEDTDIPVPRNYHQWLVQRYGENYMYPPKKKTRKHLNLFIQFDKKDKL
ncbi:MAG: LicD family protein [Erysipelotrichaceae bacterium]|nr:LicD family protein [Erysipelotrichaceae bacterium]